MSATPNIDPLKIVGHVAQAAAISANTAKTGITTQQSLDITNNNAKTGISSGQAAAISANTAKVIPELTKSLYLENPVDADDIPIWEPGVAITITKVVAQTLGGVSTTINFIKKTGSGDVNLWTTSKVITNFVEYNSFDSASCAGGDYIHYICTAKSGVSTGIKITITYTQD
jgi:hypothetical protein